MCFYYIYTVTFRCMCNIVVSSSVTHFGTRAFAVAGPKAWNQLPMHIRARESGVSWPVQDGTKDTFPLHWLSPNCPCMPLLWLIMRSYYYYNSPEQFICYLRSSTQSRHCHPDKDKRKQCIAVVKSNWQIKEVRSKLPVDVQSSANTSSSVCRPLPVLSRL